MKEKRYSGYKIGDISVISSTKTREKFKQFIQRATKNTVSLNDTEKIVVKYAIIPKDCASQQENKIKQTTDEIIKSHCEKADGVLVLIAFIDVWTHNNSPNTFIVRIEKIGLYYNKEEDKEEITKFYDEEYPFSTVDLEIVLETFFFF